MNGFMISVILRYWSLGCRKQLEQQSAEQAIPNEPPMILELLMNPESPMTAL
jgi:hypothetical protein